ncbi:MAG: hypothetical protein Q8N16_03835 [bacterium]|nr:hypothetical protein [bacterium]
MAKLIKIGCIQCGKSTFRSRGRMNENQKLGWKVYCSRKCEYQHKNRRQLLSCENCGKHLQRSPHAISPHNYCSQSCGAIVNNKKRPERNAKKIKCKNCGKEFKRWIVGNKKYCSMDCFAKAKLYNKEKLLEIIKNTAKKLRRVPTKREFLGGIDKACVRFFGSWNKAVSAAGFIPNRSHDNRMYKRSNAKSLDGHLCDSISELLIDNWFHKNNILHERDACYPETNHKADWVISTGDKKVFVEYFGLANDSPRYDRTIKEKRKLCQKNKIFLIAIYPRDLYPKNLLEDNLKRKFKNFINGGVGRGAGI